MICLPKFPIAYVRSRESITWVNNGLEYHDMHLVSCNGSFNYCLADSLSMRKPCHQNQHRLDTFSRSSGACSRKLVATPSWYAVRKPLPENDNPNGFPRARMLRFDDAGYDLRTKNLVCVVFRLRPCGSDISLRVCPYPKLVPLQRKSLDDPKNSLHVCLRSHKQPASL